MRKILIIGAGKSTALLIEYLLIRAKEENLHILLADKNIEPLQNDFKNKDHITLIALDIDHTPDRQKAIQQVDLVISMLPARFHICVAKDCLLFHKNLITASYVSAEMQTLNAEAKEKGILFLNEMGLDPGIDHMSAMQLIDTIRAQGGKIMLFESFCGGLVAPESDDNLWNYKFTWSPRNVVLAGQGGTAEFIQEGTYKYIPYQRIFRRTEFLEVEGYGRFEAYANRNSLAYREAYGLEDVLTLYRGTMRRVGFSRAWNIFVQLGMTDDSYYLRDTATMSYREFTNLFLPYSLTDSVQLKLRHLTKIDQDDLLWDKLVELDLFNSKKLIGLTQATPAQCLQKILEDKWTLQPHDKDMIVMYHKLGYELNGKKQQIDTTMVCLGEDQKRTAMAKTVGLPVAMAAIRVLNGEIALTGVHIPIFKSIYEPILAELKTYGISFKEKQVPYLGYNPNILSN